MPWFLTANHCIATQLEAQSVVCYWDYYATGCSGSAPPISTIQQSLIRTSS